MNWEWGWPGGPAVSRFHDFLGIQEGVRGTEAARGLVPTLSTRVLSAVATSPEPGSRSQRPKNAVLGFLGWGQEGCSAWLQGMLGMQRPRLPWGAEKVSGGGKETGCVHEHRSVCTCIHPCTHTYTCVYECIHTPT